MSTTTNGRRDGRPGSRPPKMALLLAQQIVGEIADRKLAPDDPLLPERQMLEQYGVARGTLREALRFLEMQDVIRIKTGPGGGPVVGELTARPVASTVALMSHLSGTPFRDVLEARLVLEPALASRAALRGTAADFDAIDDSVRRLEESAGDMEMFLAVNEGFHQLVARAAGNAILGSFMGSLHWIIDGTPLGAEYTVPERRTVVKAHRRIAERLRARDAEGSAAEMTRHVEGFATYLDRRHPEILDAPLRWDQLQW